jgi:hypothetical protein
MERRVIARGVPALLALAVAACSTVKLPSSTPPEPSPSARPAVESPSLGFFSRIKAPDDTAPVLRLTGRGVQIFRCETRQGRRTWVFRQPDAELRDPAQAGGAPVVRHGFNYIFEHADGSRLLSRIVSYDNAPESGAVPWLLLSAKSYGAGALAGVTFVQRVNTRGGMPPPSCDNAAPEQLLRVDFSADFVFYRPKSSAP